MNNVDCVIFPEGAFIGRPQDVQVYLERIKLWAIENNSFCIVQSEYARENREISNAAQLINPHGEIDSVYEKMNLVIADESDFYTKGNNVTLFDIKGINAGILICYDVMFAGVYSQIKSMGADFIISLSNDTFSGLSPIPYIHFTYSRMFALQEHLYVIHVYQSGCSGVAWPNGEISVFL